MNNKLTNKIQNIILIEYNQDDVVNTDIKISTLKFYIAEKKKITGICRESKEL